MGRASQSETLFTVSTHVPALQRRTSRLCLSPSPCIEISALPPKQAFRRYGELEGSPEDLKYTLPVGLGLVHSTTTMAQQTKWTVKVFVDHRITSNLLLSSRRPRGRFVVVLQEDFWSFLLSLGLEMTFYGV